MELGDQLKELNLTAEEMDRFSKAFKDEKFREMLSEYAKEISDPENKKKYEEEIKILEQQRGNNVEFIHPTPFRVIKTSEDGKHRCFINICANEKIGKPESKSAVSEDGRRGHCWSLPHTINPGRQETDAKGNKFKVYDIVFNPDTLYLASKNKSFVDMVDKTAIQSIKKAFKVTLDEKNVKTMRTKYKGTPQACVIRKSIPGFKANEPSEEPDPLAFPYPDEAQKKAKPPKENNQASVPLSKEPTTPKYTVKFRSFFDLQDFRCSRDSAQSPRPKEIVVTIDLPLLKTSTNSNLEVKEKSLLLETTKPAYRLELTLAYPVDEDKGEAKFNKQKRQLIITLPVRPPDLASEFSICYPASTDKSKLVEQIKCEETETKQEQQKEFELGDGEEKDHKMLADTGEEEGKEDQGKETESEQKAQEEEEKTSVEKNQEMVEITQISEVEESRIQKQKTNEMSGGEELINDEKLQNMEQSDQDGPLGQKKKQNKNTKSINPNKVEDKNSEPAVNASCLQEKESYNEENITVHNKPEVLPVNVTLVHDQHSAMQSSKLTSEPEMKPDDHQEAENTKETQENEVQIDVAPHNYTPSGESQITADTNVINPSNEVGMSSEEVQSTDGLKTSDGGDPNEALSLHAANPAAVPENEEDVDEDDLPTEQIVQTATKPPPVLLREIDADGKETVIADHSTSAGISFLNKLVFELD